MKTGIKQQMAAATSKDELETLFTLAGSYEGASNKTQRQWMRTYRRMTAKLGKV